MCIGVFKTFFLHLSQDKQVSMAAYHGICSTLKPLVDDCTLLLTKKASEGSHCTRAHSTVQVSAQISESMLLKPDAYPDWVNVLFTGACPCSFQNTPSRRT